MASGDEWIPLPVCIAARRMPRLTNMDDTAQDPPFFTVRPKAIYQRQPTQTVAMPCQAQGDPKPTIAWRKARMVIIIAFDGAIFSPHKRPTKIQYGCDEVSKVDRVYDLTSSDFAEALERDLTAERFSSNAMDTHGLYSIHVPCWCF
ncbi:hypothetical protein CAPTEDRAFT_193231 [Capitella teleta]|uniref:Ig-like domain-containing protein n=1 Tax=Capitella teleta TaxID=283909 RepID=R7UI50_CAPTE|nr:hypothetical protein CAPTEDRAFT_193231 [Capitella teleta]|eukprot:ELU05783.1 hypothetical protein CAPTEDRAFT_193231 [Capitella teleta]